MKTWDNVKWKKQEKTLCSMVSILCEERKVEEEFFKKLIQKETQL